MTNQQIQPSLVSAKGANSSLARRGEKICIPNIRALKARRHRIASESIAHARTALCRAFSARFIFESHPGALPQATDDTAPSALNRYGKGEVNPEGQAYRTQKETNKFRGPIAHII
jgi:hypothetical protein